MPAGSYVWESWQSYYAHDPFKTLPASQMANSSLMLGAEVDQWGEGIDDNNFAPHVFPSLSAAAEKMWSPQGIRSEHQVAQRIATHVCDLQRAGVRLGG